MTLCGHKTGPERVIRPCVNSTRAKSHRPENASLARRRTWTDCCSAHQHSSGGQTNTGLNHRSELPAYPPLPPVEGWFAYHMARGAMCMIHMKVSAAGQLRRLRGASVLSFLAWHALCWKPKAYYSIRCVARPFTGGFRASTSASAPVHMKGQ